MCVYLKYMNKKLRFFYSIFTFCLVLLTVITITTIHKIPNFEEMFVKAKFSEKKNLILTLTFDPKSNQVNIDNAIINDGFPLKKQVFSQSDSVITHHLINDKEEILAPVTFSKYSISENASNFTDNKDSRNFYSKPTTYISIPYSEGEALYLNPTENARNIQISTKISPTRQVLDKTKLLEAYTKMQNVNKSPDFAVMLDGQDLKGEDKQAVLQSPSQNLQATQYLDVLFISSHYTDLNLFQSDANAMANFMINYYPFNLYSQRIRFIKLNNTQETGCHYTSNWLLHCDVPAVLQIASQVNYDVVVVVENNNNYAGSGLYDYPMAFIYRDVSQWARQLLMHEFGHTLFGLSDEYSYGAPYQNPADVRENCDVAPNCPKWNSVNGSECVSICGFTNAYRSISNGVMQSPSSSQFGPVNVELIHQKFYRMGISRNPGNQ